MRLLTRPLAALPLIAACSALSACGTPTIDAKNAESVIHSAVGRHEQPTSITCPSGVKAQKDKTFDCRLSYRDGTKATMTLHMTDDSGQLRGASSDFHIVPGTGPAPGSSRGTAAPTPGQAPSTASGSATGSRSKLTDSTPLDSAAYRQALAVRGVTPAVADCAIRVLTAKGLKTAGQVSYQEGRKAGLRCASGK